MNLLRSLPEELSDEAAAHIVELLHDLTDAFECHYFAQVRRYYHDLRQRPDIQCACHDGQLDLFDGADIPF